MFVTSCKKETPVTSTPPTPAPTAYLLSVNSGYDGGGMNYVQVNGNTVTPPMNVKIGDVINVFAVGGSITTLDANGNVTGHYQDWAHAEVFMNGTSIYKEGCYCTINWKYTVK